MMMTMTTNMMTMMMLMRMMMTMRMRMTMMMMMMMSKVNSCRPNALSSSPAVGSLISASTQNLTLYLYHDDLDDELGDRDDDPDDHGDDHDSFCLISKSHSLS